MQGGGGNIIISRQEFALCRNGFSGSAHKPHGALSFSGLTQESMLEFKTNGGFPGQARE